MSDSMPCSTNAPPIAKSAAKRIRKVQYDPHASLATARTLYFDANGFPPNGGYEAKWVDFELGPIPMPFPNTDSRRRAVRVHDLHHVLTGYATDIFGELEISAWELGAGCADMAAAWVLNLGGMALGTVIAPRRTFRAWVRGRRSRSLYRTSIDETFLARHLGDVRTELGLDEKPGPARPSDVGLFFLYWQVGAWGSLVTAPIGVASAIGVAVAGLFRKGDKKVESATVSAK